MMREGWSDILHQWGESASDGSVQRGKTLVLVGNSAAPEIKPTMSVLD